MPVGLVALSHSPLIGLNQPEDAVVRKVDGAVERAREFIADFDPEVVVLFAPDHYNGFFYEKMPPFCLATGAVAIGDFGSASGDIKVDVDTAKTLGARVLELGIDLTISARMQVDHGFVQPLEVLFDGIDRVPTVPIFVNGVAARSVRSVVSVSSGMRWALPLRNSTSGFSSSRPEGCRTIRPSPSSKVPHRRLPRPSSSATPRRRSSASAAKTACCRPAATTPRDRRR